LPKLLEYYENYSKIFPNYIILHEAKYIYKNIQRKQKMIDNMQLYEINRNKDSIVDEDNVLNTEIYNSILNQTSMCKDNSLLMKQAKYESCCNDSVDKLIDRIAHAESGTLTERRKDGMYSNNGTIDSVNSKTIEFAKDSVRGNLILKNDIKSRMANINSLKAIKDKLANNSKNKYDFLKRKDSSKSRETISKPLHKSTLSIPKLNNIFYIINQNPQINTHITIYQNINNKTGLSPATGKDLIHKKSTSKNDKKKDYKKLLRPELFNQKEELKKRNEISASKVSKKIKLNYADDKSIKGNITTRNVIFSNLVFKRFCYI
jgi:hypothetical protein